MTYDDVSTEIPFSQIIEKQYVSLVDLRALGITMDQNYSPPIDHYALTKIYKFDHQAPEILTKWTLKSGAKIKVIKVIQCNNCLFSSHIEIEIEVLNERKKIEKPIFIMYELIDQEEPGMFELKSDIFKKIN
jgi:hypothetical protein